MLYNSKLVIERVKQLGDYTKKNKPMSEWGYWICGVRSEADEADRFDDTFYLFKGEEFIMETTGTTNPGVEVLKGGFRKYNNDGAAVVESDRIYWGVWKYGKHLGWMPALKQLGNSITIWRDGNCNDRSEEIGKRTTGWYGINFHTATKSYMMDIVKTLIGGWSAGCQVANNTKDYRKIINLCKTQDKTTYVLLKEFSV
jgi:hypothetical protein